MTDVAAFSILVMTVSLSLSRPRFGPIRIHHSWAAVIGASLTLMLGIVPVPLAIHAFHVLAYPVITIVSLMIITLIAERAGLFEILARRIAVMAKGNGKKLFAYLFFCGTLTGSVFTNDAAVLIFTPLVFNLVEEIKGPGWTRYNKLPYYFAVLYVANLVGALIISNPINIIVSSLFHIDFLEYARWMVIPAAASILVSYFGLKYYFFKNIPNSFILHDLPDPRPKNTKFLVISAVMLLLTLVGFFSGHLFGISTWMVALGSALILMIIHGIVRRSNNMEILQGVGWDVIVFVVGIFIVAYGLRNAGLTDHIGQLLAAFDGPNQLKMTSATAFVAAICSSIMNNHPTANIMAMVIDDMKIPESKTKMLVFSALIGGDIGPKMLPIGSLAALLWFRILRDRGVYVPYSLYIKIGIPVTLAGVLVAVLTLNLESYLAGLLK